MVWFGFYLMVFWTLSWVVVDVCLLSVELLWFCVLCAGVVEIAG